MKQFVLILVLIGGIFISNNLFGNPDSTIITNTSELIVKDKRVDELVLKRIEINERREGKFEGYRVQIHFGSDREQAKQVKAKFMEKYKEVEAYDTYDQPNFKVRIGDFRTRLDAFGFMKQIISEFPGAFIVQCEINMPDAIEK